MGMKLPKMDRSNIKKLIHYVFPITTWLPKYNLQQLRGDMIAGLTVGIMIIPQSIAFASLSGLPPQYGLYAALIPGFVYAIFGTSKDLSMGPTVTMALFTHRYNVTLEPIGASSLAFLVGVVLILMALLRLGSIANFLPTHVLNGFISAAAITIMVSQLRDLFGHEKPPSNILEKIRHFLTNIHKPNWWDLSLSFGCIIYLAFFMWLSKRTPKKSSVDKRQSIVKLVFRKLIWFLCVGRSALVCILATVIAYVFLVNGYKMSFTLAGILPKGLPFPKFPLQSAVTSTNTTITTQEFVEGFGASLVILPTIQFIQTISISKAFGKLFKYDVDSSQELLALGLSNILGSIFGGFPVTGSFSRSAVNSASGAATPLSGMFTGVVIILALSFLTPIFQYIPKSSLASMIIMAVITMIDVQTPLAIWKINKIDMIPYLLALLGSFYKLEAGVIAGAVAALLIIVVREIKPKHECAIEDDVLTVSFKQTPNYPCVEQIKDLISHNLKTHEKIEIVTVDLNQVDYVDFAILSCFKEIASDFKDANVKLKFINMSHNVHESLLHGKILEEANTINKIGKPENSLCIDSQDSIDIEGIKNETFEDTDL